MLITSGFIENMPCRTGNKAMTWPKIDGRASEDDSRMFIDRDNHRSRSKLHLNDSRYHKPKGAQNPSSFGGYYVYTTNRSCWNWYWAYDLPESVEALLFKFRTEGSKWPIKRVKPGRGQAEFGDRGIARKQQFRDICERQEVTSETMLRKRISKSWKDWL